MSEFDAIVGICGFHGFFSIDSVTVDDQHRYRHPGHGRRAPPPRRPVRARGAARGRQRRRGDGRRRGLHRGRLSAHERHRGRRILDRARPGLGAHRDRRVRRGRGAGCPGVVSITGIRGDSRPGSARCQYRGGHGVGMGGGARDRQAVGRHALARAVAGRRHPLRRARRAGHREPAHQHATQAHRARGGAGILGTVPASRRGSRGGRTVRERTSRANLSPTRAGWPRLVLPRRARRCDRRGSGPHREPPLARRSGAAPGGDQGTAPARASTGHRIQLPAAHAGPRLADDSRHLRASRCHRGRGVRASARTGGGIEAGVHRARPGNRGSPVHALPAPNGSSHRHRSMRRRRRSTQRVHSNGRGLRARATPSGWVPSTARAAR